MGSAPRKTDALTAGSRSLRTVHLSKLRKAVFRRTVLIACVASMLYYWLEGAESAESATKPEKIRCTVREVHRPVPEGDTIVFDHKCAGELMVGTPKNFKGGVSVAWKGQGRVSGTAINAESALFVFERGEQPTLTVGGAKFESEPEGRGDLELEMEVQDPRELVQVWCDGSGREAAKDPRQKKVTVMCTDAPRLVLDYKNPYA